MTTRDPLAATDIHIRGAWERAIPLRLVPYSRLARWDRPIGAWLLLLPCWWGAALAAAAAPGMSAVGIAAPIVLFAVEYAWRLGLYAHQGLLDTQGLQLALTLLPALVAATLLGHFVHLRVGERVFRRWVAVFLLLSGTVCLF